MRCGFWILAILSPVWVHADLPGVMHREFLNGDPPPTRSCHASTIEQTSEGLVAAWFGGTYEKHPDVGIWVTRQTPDGWTRPVEVANGIQYSRPDGTVHRHPTWNPVLFQYPDGPLLLFFKCGPSPSEWWGMVMSSSDHGKTWTDPRRLPEHIDGPVRCKPLLLDNGRLLCGSSTEFDGWRVHFEWTCDQGRTWSRIPAIHDGRTFGAIQPTLLRHADGRLQALMRNQDGEGRILSTESSDGGDTWSELQEIALPNPNSGIDAVRLSDGRFLLVYNHTNRRGTVPRSREMINLAVSRDGKHWQAAGILEQEKGAEFSYPAAIRTEDGQVHITYTWKRRRIRYVNVNPDRLLLTDFDGDRWPFALDSERPADNR